MQGDDRDDGGAFGGAAAGGGQRRKTWDRAAAPVTLKDTETQNSALSAAGVDPSYREYLAALQVKCAQDVKILTLETTHALLNPRHVFPHFFPLGEEQGAEGAAEAGGEAPRSGTGARTWFRVEFRWGE